MPDDTTPMESGLGRWNAATPDPGRTDSNFGTSRAETPNYDDRGTTQTPRGNVRTYNRVMRRNVRRG